MPTSQDTEVVQPRCKDWEKRGGVVQRNHETGKLVNQTYTSNEQRAQELVKTYVGPDSVRCGGGIFIILWLIITCGQLDIRRLNSYGCSGEAIKKIKSSLHSRYHTEACNERRGNLRGLALGQHKPMKHCSAGETVNDLTRPGIEHKTFRTDSNVFHHFLKCGRYRQPTGFENT